MNRKGYGFELFIKKKLEAEYGKGNVIKMPFWNFIGDMLVIRGNTITLMAEAKSSQGKWYPSSRERKQFRLMNDFCASHGIEGCYYIRENGEKPKVLSMGQVAERVRGKRKCVDVNGAESDSFTL